MDIVEKILLLTVKEAQRACDEALKACDEAEKAYYEARKAYYETKEAWDKTEEAKPTDTELLDWLDANQRHMWPGRGWICRCSTTGRGLRLHETTREGAYSTVREAIRNAIRCEAWLRRALEEQK